MDGDMSGFVKVTAQEDTPKPVTSMHFTGSIDPTASASKSDVHKGYVRAMRLRGGERRIGTVRSRANLVSTLCHEHFKMHRNQHLVLNN
jgi:hypothetical protein